MSLHQSMHVVAICFTVLAVCIHRGWRSRASVPGLAAAILMLAAMVDVVYANRMSVVVWTPLLILAAIALAAGRSARRRREDDDSDRRAWVLTHDPLGLVATAAMLPLMHTDFAAASDHAHGAPASLLIAVVLLVAAGHVLGSAVAARFHAARVDRVQYTAMALASGFMAFSITA